MERGREGRVSVLAGSLCSGGRGVAVKGGGVRGVSVLGSGGSLSWWGRGSRSGGRVSLSPPPEHLQQHGGMHTTAMHSCVLKIHKYAYKTLK